VAAGFGSGRIAMSIFDSLRELGRRGEAAALCTVIRTRGSVPRHAGSKMLVRRDGGIEGTIGGGEMEARVIADALSVLASGLPRLVSYALVDPRTGDPGVCGGEVEVFVEAIRPCPTILVIGGGHVGKAIVHLAAWLGFRAVVSDERPEFCTPEAVPGADEYLPMSIEALCRRFTFTDDTYIVMPTRGVGVDVDGVPMLLDMPHAYLGVIGSRRRWATAVQQLQEKGVPRDKLERVHAPMGLELNAETPEEIAMSVLAEILMLRNRGTGATMKWLGEPEDAQS
jgi:xanthine dehydrogenase accessory factor